MEPAQFSGQCIAAHELHRKADLDLLSSGVEGLLFLRLDSMIQQVHSCCLLPANLSWTSNEVSDLAKRYNLYSRTSNAQHVMGASASMQQAHGRDTVVVRHGVTHPVHQVF